jgi:transposase
MAAALSQALRERAIAAIEAGGSCRLAAERFGLGRATAIR